MNEFTDFDNQEDVPDQMRTPWDFPLFDVESKSSQMWFWFHLQSCIAVVFLAEF